MEWVDRRDAPRLAVLVGALCLIGCTTPLGVVSGLLGPEAYPPAMVLATGATGEDCTSSALALPSMADGLARAVERALATVPEATLLVDVEISTNTLTTGLYNRRCVRVHGSAAKLVTSIVVMPPGGHHSEHH